MQNKTISMIALGALLFGTGAVAQAPVPPTPPAGGTEQENVAAREDALTDFSAGISQKKTVDFPARSSLDSMELAPLPGIYETNMTGPQAMAESVSVNDTPSEQLLGRLTPAVFQEMAELERDNAYLKLQIQKEQMKNDLENARSQYRQARLDEIAKREEVVRSRIQWWQEQEKLRQEVEKERAAAEEVKNQMAEAEALKAQLAAQAATAATQETALEEREDTEESLTPETPAVATYALVDVKGTRGNLKARVRNLTTNEVVTVSVGDSLNQQVITAITSEKVVVDKDGTEFVIGFPNG